MSSDQSAGVWHKVGEHSPAGTAAPSGVAGVSLDTALGHPTCSSLRAAAAFGDGLKQGANARQFLQAVICSQTEGFVRLHCERKWLKVL